ncbi:hypothetical protein HPGCJGGD_2569 [Methylobacterium haplocladii]|nr:hypothetical protein HPGCJGGD_2569 [Methylobacterium haplocladii]
MLRAVATAFLANSATPPETDEEPIIVLSDSMPAWFLADTRTDPAVEVTVAASCVGA